MYGAQKTAAPLLRTWREALQIHDHDWIIRKYNLPRSIISPREGYVAPLIIPPNLDRPSHCFRQDVLLGCRPDRLDTAAAPPTCSLGLSAISSMVPERRSRTACTSIGLHRICLVLLGCIPLLTPRLPQKTTLHALLWKNPRRTPQSSRARMSSRCSDSIPKPASLPLHDVEVRETGSRHPAASTRQQQSSRGANRHKLSEARS
jgi:hypothetical protein